MVDAKPRKMSLFKGYKNIDSWDPKELVISPNLPIDVDPLVCKTCKLFAMAPRQCINCFSLVCCNCVAKSGDSKNCPTCKSQGGKPNSLDNPNVLNDETHKLLERVSFVCPNVCGVRNLEMLEVHTHLIFFCEKGASENK